MPTGEDRMEDLRSWTNSLEAEADILRNEIAARQGRLSALEEELQLLRRLVRLHEPHAADAPSNGVASAGSAPKQARTRSASTADADLIEEVAQILDENGEPLHISMIRERLVERGVTIPGRGDDANIIVRISPLQDRFMRTARGTYALTSWGLQALTSPKRKRTTKKRGR